MRKLTEDERYMREAVRQAKKAWALGEVPIGCVIVHRGKIIGRGYNRRTTDGNVLAHAEILAIRKACRIIGDWRLEECTMYVTLEPCPMCAGAIINARIPRVVIGAMDPKAGSCGSVVIGCMNPKAGCAGSVLDLLHEEGFNHQAETEVGTLGEECSSMLKEFFRELRVKGKEKKRLLREEAAEAEGREKQEPTG